MNAQADDLVQRLRQAAKDIQWEQPLASERERLAADALEQLQAEVRDTATMRDLARAEVVRLQQALRDLLDVLERGGWSSRVDYQTALAAARAVLEGNQQ